VTQSTLTLILLSLFLGAGAWLIFLWAAKRGEFDDLEGPKHRMLEEDDHPLPPPPKTSVPPPGAKKPRKGTPP